VKAAVLVFTAHWSDNCYYTAPLWHKMADKFSTRKLKFYEIDCSKFPDLHKEFKIDTNIASNQLPTLILLENNKEHLRFPPSDMTKSRFTKINYKFNELVKYFDLEQRLLTEG